MAARQRKNQKDIPCEPVQSNQNESPSKTKATKARETKKNKFGSLGLKKEDQLWSRAVLMTGVLIIVIVTRWRKSNEITWVSQQELLAEVRSQPVTCAQSFLNEISQYEGCAIKQCARLVEDGLFSESEVKELLNVFKKGLQYGQSSGGASILDLHSGALSMGERFINVFALLEGKSIWTEAELAAYVKAKEKVRHAIARNFALQPEAIYLTSPTFFSQMTANPAKTVHDEYWHPHVDKETYETFHFTSLLYLSDYGAEFEGGRFVFVDDDRKNRTVEPRKGRVSMFTSGAENLHYVEKVSSGVRYALTIAFTCDAKHAIPDPHARH